MIRRITRFLIFVGCLFSICQCAFAQRHEQLWLDYQIDYPFANQYLFEVNGSYQTVLTKDRWRSINVGPTFEYSVLNNLDLLSEVSFTSTLQKEGSNSFEIAPMVGVRYHITQGKRVVSRLLLRYQERNFYQIEDKYWDVSNRVRLKGEMNICINGPNLFTDNLWYAILDYEEFVVMDDQVNERYANRRRARIGISYRYNYEHRFDLIYTRQTSRNEIGDDFVSNDNVIQLRYKMFLNPGRQVGSQSR